MKVKYNSRDTFLLESVLYFCLNALCIIQINPIFSFICLVLTLTYFIRLAVRSFSFFLKYIYFYFAAISNIVGVAICEYFHVSLVELGIAVSSFVGSLPIICCGWSIFFAVTYYLDSLDFNINNVSMGDIEKQTYSNIDKIQALIIDRIIPWAYLIGYGIIFIKVFPQPAFLLHLDRFMYEQNFPLGNLTTIMTVLGYFKPILFVMIYKNRNRTLSIIGLSVSLLVYLWVGHKFGIFMSFVMLACMVLAIYYQKHKDSISIKRYIWIPFSLGIAILAVSSIMGANADQNTNNYLLTRTAQQGQMWWRVYDLVKSTNTHPSEFSDELNIWFSGKDDDELQSYNYGIYHMMRYAAGDSLTEQKILTGSRYTEAGFASAYYYFGFFGAAIFALSMGMVISICIKWLVVSMDNLWVIETIILFRLLSILQTTLSMFTFNSLFSEDTIASIVVLIICLFVRRKKLVS